MDMHPQLHARLTRDYEPLLWRDDASVLLSGSSDVEARCQLSNKNALELVNMHGPCLFF
jgi:cystathionine beta-lyase/cystathionine gamma-synthase